MTIFNSCVRILTQPEGMRFFAISVAATSRSSRAALLGNFGIWNTPVSTHPINHFIIPNRGTVDPITQKSWGW